MITQGQSERRAENSVTLREFFEARFAAQEKALELREKISDHKFSELNHLREERMQERSIFLTVDYYNGQHNVLTEKINAVRDRQMWIAGVGSVLVVIAGILGGLIGHWTK